MTDSDRDAEVPVHIFISADLYAALTQDGIENERTPKETIRWALRQYLKMQEEMKNPMSYAQGFPIRRRTTPTYPIIYKKQLEESPPPTLFGKEEP